MYSLGRKTSVPVRPTAGQGEPQEEAFYGVGPRVPHERPYQDEAGDKVWASRCRW